MFTKKGWRRRYALATHEGLGLCRANPRDKVSVLAGRPLKILHAKSFIPFAKKRNGEVEMQPAYVVDDVSAARHPEAPQKSHNGICSGAVSLAEGGSSTASVRDLTSNDNKCTYYYFGLSFEEHRKRYLLLLRTFSPQDYIIWSTYLPLCGHEGSTSRIVPTGHPLEADRPQPIDHNYRRLTEKRESMLPSTVTLYLDPNPCTVGERVKVRRLCLDWDEGERRRIFTTAVDRVRSLCGISESTGSASIAKMQDKSEEECRKVVSSLFEELSPAMPKSEDTHPPRRKDTTMPKRGVATTASVGMAARSSGAAHPHATHIDTAEGAANGLSMRERSKQSASQCFFPNLLVSSDGAGSGSKEVRKHPKLENGGAAACSSLKS
ncbi:conserved hypothetical protein [Leishmania major strain Friedlin]|uniref:Uncharacterized protein n=1 Tax=Leishmania major TaxID=5664 RepID=Q4QA10_LEIMA|nr:conserved hypothetical protein [Leishmania major strain Friedlin]CAG9575097.1 hypothetical_protein_-_conserved [Leishmania major strain Friedlin]CAJ04989.1 conserved hypothetical protein [Leishmania major strain Friedlin]|eukprot:XP_001683838.1 conserved hypothetical protein [Leishmania major strain Friedlin]